MARFGVQHLSLFDESRYYTVVVNITGSLIMGILWVLLDHFCAGRNWQVLVFTGLLGGYTTYSAFALESLLLLRSGQAVQSLLYLGITLLGGLAACAAGFMATEQLLKRFA